MARVFLSYDHEDEERVAPIVAALQKAGHQVWWDRQIHGGAQYNSEIESAVANADAVVVLWSEQSVQSAWVRDEAAEGRDSGKLIPLTLDGARPPMGFRQFQTIDLSTAKGARKAAKLRELAATVDKVVQVGSQAPDPAHSAARRQRKLRAPWAVFAALGAVAVAGAAIWHFTGSAAQAPIVAVEAGDDSPAARALARDLLVKLGSAGSSDIDAVQIVGDGATKRPDLILEVSAGQSAQSPSANLLLLRAGDRQLLSSQDLAASAGASGDLKTSVVVAATSAIGCAKAALASRPALPLDALKQYLGPCERFNALYGMEDVSILIPQLQRIVERQPRFVPAWKQLLLAGTYVLSVPTDVAKPSRQWLRAKVEAARRVEPDMPEIRLAQVELLPMTDFAGRMKIVDSLRDAHPDDNFVLGSRAEQLMLVGRNNDAVVDAERTARLDPYSPYSRSEYIRTLAYSGRLPRAFEELESFKPFSPVAMSVADTRFRVNMRYGEPQAALDILRMYGTSKAHEAFLLARLKPTTENIEHALQIARSVAAERGYYAMLAEVLAPFGRDDEIYEMLMQVPRDKVDQYTLQTLFRPTLKNLRQNPRFLQIAARYGLLDYWRSSGNWPDFCLEPGLPYDCKKEAAKLQ